MKVSDSIKRAVPFCLCLCMLCCLLPAIAATSGSTASIKLCILSDLHYLAAADQAAADGNEWRLYGESAPATEEAIEAVIRQRPDVLLLTGDLTSGAGRASAEELAQKLQKVEQAGIRVFVINGESDMSGGLSPAEFRDIFHAYGYDGADSAVYYQPQPSEEAVQGSLSYAVTPKPGIRLLMIDSEAHAQGVEGGAISDGLMKWVLQQADRARQNGETLIAGIHRPLLAHQSGARSNSFNGTIHNSSEIARQFANAGLSYFFTGHMHETDVAQYTSPEGNWLLDMETGSLVTYGAPIRTATVEGGQITLQSESVKEITWQGQRIDYQEHLRQSLFSETAFAGYAMRFLDGPLNTLESDGLKKGVETLVKTGELDSALQKAIQSALQQPLAINLSGNLNLTLRLDGADTVLVESSASFLLPAPRISISSDLIPMAHDLFAQFDDQWLTADANGKSPLRKEVEQMVEKLCRSALSQTASGQPYTVSDFLTELMLAHSVGQEEPNASFSALLEQLNPALTQALITEQLLPAAASLCDKMLSGLKLDASYLSSGAGALWKPALGIVSSMRAGTLAKLAGFSAADMLKKAFTDERMRQIGAFVSGLAAGFYVDTEGVDDRVDGFGVRYRDGSGVLLTEIPSEASVPEDFVLLQTTEVISTQPVSQAGQTRTTATSETASALTPDGPSALPSAPLRPPSSPPAAKATVGTPFVTTTLPAILFMAAAAFAASDCRRF